MSNGQQFLGMPHQGGARPPSSSRVGRILLLPIAIGALFSALLIAADYYPRTNPHAHFQTPVQCPKCHIMHGSTPDTSRFSTEVDDFCLGCHKKESLGRSHPSQVRPREKYWKMKVPEDFRLDDDGRIMCLTCHRAHGPHLSTVKAFSKQTPVSTNSTGGPFYKTFFLRLSSPTLGFASLCDGCHKKL